MIRRLQESDIESLLTVRREALTAEPAAFSASPQTDHGLDPEFLRKSIAQTSTQAIFGAFRNGKLVGITGVHRKTGEKERHKAVLWGMYISAASRGMGLGRALLSEATLFARSLPGVTHLHLSVSESASRALCLYQTAGFTTWGLEPASLIVNGESIAVRHMVLEFASKTASLQL